MAINFSSELQDDILYITSSGVDERLQDVQNYTLSVITKSKETGCKKLLIDERELEYRLNTIDTFQLAEFASEKIPRVAKIAIVPNPVGINDAQFYENVVSNRGIRLRIFRDLNAAKTWLK